MQAYAAALVATTLHGSRDVNGDRNGWDKPPKGRSAAVAERCALTTREHGSHPAAFVGELGVADGVDPLMNAVQTAHPGAVSNPIRIEPCGQQLHHRENTMLPGSDPRGDRIRIDAFPGHIPYKASNPADSPLWPGPPLRIHALSQCCC